MMDRFKRQSTGWMLLYVVTVHGPVDMLTTATHFDHESNPLVLELGLQPWLALKAVCMAGIVVGTVLLHEEYESYVRALLGFLCLMSLLVLPNLLFVAGVL